MDPIAAIATGSAASAIGVIRISGADLPPAARFSAPPTAFPFRLSPPESW